MNQRRTLSKLLTCKGFCSNTAHRVSFRFKHTEIIFQQLNVCIVLIGISSVVREGLRIHTVTLEVVCNTQRIITIDKINDFFFHYFVFNNSSHLNQYTNMSHQIGRLMSRHRLVNHP